MCLCEGVSVCIVDMGMEKCRWKCVWKCSNVCKYMPLGVWRYMVIYMCRCMCGDVCVEMYVWRCMCGDTHVVGLLSSL